MSCIYDSDRLNNLGENKMKSVKDMLEEVMHELGINENINSD